MKENGKVWEWVVGGHQAREALLVKVGLKQWMTKCHDLCYFCVVKISASDSLSHFSSGRLVYQGLTNIHVNTFGQANPC